MHPSRRTFAGLLWVAAAGFSGCAHRVPQLFAPMQADGWSARPVALVHRFTSDAELEPATRTLVGDEGYYLYVLTRAGDWDYRTSRSFILSHARHMWGHCWLMLEDPEHRLEWGLTGNFGLERPSYEAGVHQKIRDGDPNPISYLWETMSDGRLETGGSRHVPTFVWRMPITRQHYERIREYAAQWNFGQIGVQANNCVDFVVGAAEVAGVGLIHRVRLTVPKEARILGQTLRLWEDPKYRFFEYSTPDLLEVDLRHLTRFGIGTDVTEWYRARKR